MRTARRAHDSVPPRSLRPGGNGGFWGPGLPPWTAQMGPAAGLHPPQAPLRAGVPLPHTCCSPPCCTSGLFGQADSRLPTPDPSPRCRYGRAQCSGEAPGAPQGPQQLSTGLRPPRRGGTTQGPWVRGDTRVLQK